jgi:hypothetical protein
MRKHKTLKKILKLPFTQIFDRLARFGLACQRISFRGKNYIEFDLFKEGEK